MTQAYRMLAAAALLLGLAAPRAGAAAGEAIEPLTPPKAAPPPRQDDDRMDADLRRLRQDRESRDRAARPAPLPYAQQRRLGLLQDALAPHPKKLLMELSLVGGTVLTSGDKLDYTCAPTSHINVFFRKEPSAGTGRPGLWLGVRVAPFSGTGRYKNHPGSYGSTYFGPMIGIGNIDRDAADVGAARADPASGEVEIPQGSGWVATGGIAAVAELGASDSADPRDRTNDFANRGVEFDAPGAWAEARYLRILFGATGFDVYAGVQSGRSRTFVYGGVGAAAWY